MTDGPRTCHLPDAEEAVPLVEDGIEHDAVVTLFGRCAVEACFADRFGIELLAEQAGRIATELDATQIDSLSDRADLPCTSHCEATTPADCDRL